MERNISVVKDVNGNQIVVINDIQFKGRQNINWDEVEQYLKPVSYTHLRAHET